jgi:hypothetical protein
MLVQWRLNESIIDNWFDAAADRKIRYPVLLWYAAKTRFQPAGCRPGGGLLVTS